MSIQEVASEILIFMRIPDVIQILFVKVAKAGDAIVIVATCNNATIQ